MKGKTMIVNFFKRFYRIIFGKRSGCCKIPNGNKITGDNQKSYVIQTSY